MTKIPDSTENPISPSKSKYEQRLGQVCSVGDGWYNGYGMGVHIQAATAAKMFLSRRECSPLAYRIYPTLTGGILFEFDSNGWDISIEFFSDGSVEIYGIEVKGKQEISPIHFKNIDDDFFDRLDTVIKSSNNKNISTK